MSWQQIVTDWQTWRNSRCASARLSAYRCSVLCPSTLPIHCPSQLLHRSIHRASSATDGGSSSVLIPRTAQPTMRSASAPRSALAARQYRTYSTCRSTLGPKTATDYPHRAAHAGRARSRRPQTGGRSASGARNDVRESNAQISPQGGPFTSSGSDDLLKTALQLGARFDIPGKDHRRDQAAQLGPESKRRLRRSPAILC